MLINSHSSASTGTYCQRIDFCDAQFATAGVPCRSFGYVGDEFSNVNPHTNLNSSAGVKLVPVDGEGGCANLESSMCPETKDCSEYDAASLNCYW